MTNGILSTKLHSPVIPAHHILRGALMARMQANHGRERPFTLVCAPAGYGKTTLVLAFLASVPARCAWLSLDEADNDPTRFLIYLAAALEKAGVSVGRDVDCLATDTGLQASLVLAELLDRVAAEGLQTILVLDDTHQLQGPQVTDLLRFLVEHQPPCLHLILTTREDPGFPLSRLRVSNRLLEIRMDELSFSGQEATAFYRDCMGLSLEDASAERLTTMTEGWAAGMQLAGLLLNGLDGEKVHSAIARFDGSNRYIIDYLVEEVLQRQPMDIREFLCRTSVLDRLEASLCAALIGNDDCMSILLRLEKANLFLIPLDTRRKWFRYHHLFAHSLRLTLPADEESDLLRKAALWHRESGEPTEAIEYALRSGDADLALPWVEEATKEAFQEARLETLLRWISLLPEDKVRTSEVLAVRKSIALFIVGRPQEAVRHLATLGPAFGSTASRHNRGLLLCMQALQAVHSRQDAEPPAAAALALLEPFDFIARASMLNTLGKAKLQKGHAEEALAIFREAYATGFGMGYSLVTTLALVNYGMCLDAAGRLDEAFQLYASYRAGMIRQYGRTLPYIGLVDVACAELHYERNELDAAHRMMEEGVTCCRAISYHWLIPGVTRANILHACEEKEEACRVLTDVLMQPQPDGLGRPDPAVVGTLVRFAIQKGDRSEITRHGGKLKTFLHSPHAQDRAEALIPGCRLLLWEGDWQMAEPLLQEAKQAASAQGAEKRLIPILVLLAITHRMAGRGEEAIQYLNQATHMASASGNIRAILDEAPLLERHLPEAMSAFGYPVSPKIKSVRK